MLEVDGEPILGHVLEIYARQGFTEFILAAGYLADRIDAFAQTLPAEWKLTVIDTGEETNTGERVARCREHLRDRFMVNYADGLGNVDVHKLLAFHDSHPGSATLTTVPLPSQYGTIETDDASRVTTFREKPRLPDHHINGGYFVFDQRAFEHWDGHDLERDVLPALGAAGELFAFRHDGFWKSMDTYKDAIELTAIAADDPPWLKLPAPD